MRLLAPSALGSLLRVGRNWRDLGAILIADIRREILLFGRASRRRLHGHELAVVFIGIAVLTRLVFWAYTDRTWEDALITLTPAANVWDGVGLTHHASEPRVHSFTSPISVLIPLVGEAFGQGLFLIKLISLFAAGVSAYYAYRICLQLKMHVFAQGFVLAYLATDQLQIFFGMSGMETQIATAVLLANAYYYLSSQWTRLGLALGVAALCRPEFILWGGVLGMAMLLLHRREILRVALAAILVAAPWFIFATVYYGSPVPHTIIAKTFGFKRKFLGLGWEQAWDYFVGSWAHIAPFKEYWFAYQVPLPNWILAAIVGLLMLCVVLGIATAVKTRDRVLVVAAVVLVFAVYRNGTYINPYYMWYLPPFLALLVILAGLGISRIEARARLAGSAIAIGLSIAYAMHIPFSFPIDRMVQEEVEVNVRARTGVVLNRLMAGGDTAVLEPLGYIGWYARNRTIYDFPGLGSPIAFDAIARLRVPTLAGLVHELKPTFAVLRPSELKRLNEDYPDDARFYETVADIEWRPGINLAHWGLAYMHRADSRFIILKRRASGA